MINLVPFLKIKNYQKLCALYDKWMEFVLFGLCNWKAYKNSMGVGVWVGTSQ